MYGILLRLLEAEGIDFGAYVDDVVIISPAIESLSNVLCTAQQSLHRLGMQLHAEQTEVMALGTQRNTFEDIWLNRAKYLATSGTWICPAHRGGVLTDTAAGLNNEGGQAKAKWVRDMAPLGHSLGGSTQLKEVWDLVVN